MLDEQDRHPLLMCGGDELCDLLDLVAHQAGRHFVQQQQPWPQAECTRHLEPFEIEQSQTAGEPLALVEQIAPLEHLANQVVTLCPMPGNGMEWAATSRFWRTVMPPNGRGI